MFVCISFFVCVILRMCMFVYFYVCECIDMHVVDCMYLYAFIGVAKEGDNQGM